MPTDPEQLLALRAAVAADLGRFAPELAVAGGVVLLLLARLVPPLDRAHLGWLSLAAVGAGLAAAVGQWPAGPVGSGAAFTGLLALDGLALYLRILLLASAFLLLVLCRLTGLPDRADSADFGVLLLGGLLGMMLMASANHLLTAFLAVEMASLPCYALAGFLKGRKTGSEAALKYAVYGAAAAGVMLYGVSLLTAAFGTGHLPAVAAGLGANPTPLALAGGLLVLVGLGFKLAAVPFHFWLPDVFSGASAEVGAFLSVASKAAAVGLTARVLLAVPAELAPAVGGGVAVVAAVTATVGNLAALPQTDLKRLLGYSTVAHAGYMLMGLAALTHGGVAAVLVYLAAYLLMNLGAFAVVAVVRTRTGAETVAACRGLMVRSPAVGVPLAAFLLSLLGLPPLAGFAGKFLVFAAVYEAGYSWLLAVGVVNTVVSAGYYLRVLRAAGLDDPDATDEKGEPLPLGEGPAVGVYLGLLAAGLVAVGVWWGPLADAAGRAAM